MVLLSVFDSKAKCFVGGVYTSRNVEVGIRDFSQACTDKNTNLNKFPEDYALFLFGNFDENTGAIELEKSPVKISTAKEVLANG